MPEFLISDAINSQNMAELQAFLAANPGKVRLKITSGGGDLLAALNAAHQISKHGNVEAIASGHAGSAATILLAASDRAVATDTTLLMLHSPRSTASGTSDEMRATAQALDLATQSMKRIYARRIKDESRLHAAMSGADNWYSASEGLDMGILDSVEQTGSLAASGDLQAAFSVGVGTDGYPPSSSAPAGNPTSPPFPSPFPSMPAQPAMGLRSNSHDGRLRAMSDALLIRAGVIADQPANPFRAVRMDQVNATLQASTGGFAAGTDHFPGVLADSANRAIGVAFEDAARMEPFKVMCSEVLVSDFRETSLSGLSQFPAAPELRGANQELENAHLSDQKTTTQLTTYGQLFSLTRRAIVNDDLGYFAQVSQGLGESTSRALGDALAAIVLESTHGQTMSDGYALFHTNHKNAGTGAPSSASIVAGYTRLGLQRDPANLVTGARARWIWSSLSSEPAIRSVLSAEWDITDDFARAQSGAPNRARDLLSRGGGGDAVLGDYRLEPSTDGGPQAFFMVADRQFVILKLQSQQTPMVSMETLSRRDGVSFKVLFDARIAATGWWKIYRSLSS